MSFYLYIFFILLLVKLLPKNKITGILVILVLFALSAFRGENVGDDTWNYFNNILRETEFDMSSLDSYSFEISYQAVTKNIRYSGLPSYYVLWFLSAVTFIFLTLGVKRLKLGYADAVFFYYATILFFLSLNISRQMAGVSICFYGYTFLIEKGWKRLIFIPLVLLAASIHFSAIIFSLLFIIMFIPDIHFGKTKWLIGLFLLSLFVLVFVFKNQIVGVLTPYTLIFDIYDSASLTSIRAGEATLPSFITGFVRLVINIFVLIWLNKKGYYKLSYIFLIALLVSIVFNVLISNVVRLQYYLQIIYITAYSLYFSSQELKKSASRIIAFLCFIMVSLLQIYSCLRYDPFEIVPYYFN